MPPEMDLKQRVLVNGEQALAMYTRIERQVAHLSDRTAMVGRAAGGTLNVVGRVGGAILAPLKWAGVALGGVAAAATAFGGAALASAGNIEALKTRIEGVTSSAEDAARVWRETMAMAVASPFETGELVEARIGLLNIGLTGQSALRSVGDAAAVTQRGVTDFVSLLAGMETEPLRRIGISLKRDADAFEFTFRDKMQTVRKISATGMDEARNALLGIFDVKYGGGMEKFASTWQGVTSTLMDSIKIGMADIGKGLFPVAKSFVGAINNSIGEMLDSGKLAEFGAKLGERLESAFVYGKSVLEYGSKVFAAVREQGPEGMMNALRQVVGAAGQILAVSFVNYLRALGNVLSGIGKIMSSAFLEDILQLPLMTSTRGKMFAAEAATMSPADFKKTLDELGFKPDGTGVVPADIEARFVAKTRGARAFKSGIEDFTRDIPGIARETSAATQEIIRRANANIVAQSGYSGPTFDETLQKNRQERYNPADYPSMADHTMTGVRLVPAGDNTTGPYWRTERRQVSVPHDSPWKLGDVTPGGYAIIQIDNLTIKAEDKEALTRKLVAQINRSPR